VETKLNTVNMTAWVHKECDIMDEDALFSSIYTFRKVYTIRGCLEGLALMI
jgi:hypothetical protein